MTKVRWTPQAADDLQAIFDFIARDSPHYAQVTVEGILAAIDHLEQFPKLGRRVPESVREDLRELIKPPYRIVYRTGAVVKILTIVRRRAPISSRPQMIRNRQFFRITLSKENLALRPPRDSGGC